MQYLWLKCVKWLVLLFTLVFVYFKIVNRSEQLWNGVWYFFQQLSAFSILFLVLLMMVNWLLESAKWYLISQKVDPISFADATKSVLSGLCIGFITPHAIGDYFGRMLYSKEKSLIKIISPILLSRVVQLYITVFYGLIGFLILKKYLALDTPYFSFLIMVAITIFSILVFLLLSDHRILLKIGKLIPRLTKYIDKILLPLQKFSKLDHLIIVFLALLRYIVFSIQYLYVLWLLGAKVFEIKTIAGVWMVYFAKSVLPTFNFLSEISVREASALYFLNGCGIDNFLLVISGLFIWILNILTPTLVGLVFVLIAKNNSHQS